MGNIATIGTVFRLNGRKGSTQASLGVCLPKAKIAGLKPGDIVAIQVIPLSDIVLDTIIPQVLDFSTLPISTAARTAILRRHKPK